VYELQSAMMDTVIKLFLLFLLAVFNGFESLLWQVNSIFLKNNKVVMESKSLFLLPKHLFILY
jgi:hypothetical protein